ncbi:MAG: hypothetical protein U5R31_08470 [Acidimicrobiia bacterium]|nr:hypothetical protein [Acidimicrobiia bacterium]
MPARLRAALEGIAGVEEAYIFGSWAARWHGERGSRPIGDIDVLVLGGPDRDEIYVAVGGVAQLVGREIQAQIRPAGWLESGSGSFHDTLVARPMVRVLPADHQDRNDDAASIARSAS